MLHNDAASTVEIILHRMTWKVHQEWRIGYNLHGGGNGPLKKKSAFLTLRNTCERFICIFLTEFASQMLVIATK